LPGRIFIKFIRAPAVVVPLLMAVMGGLTVILKLSVADPQLKKDWHGSTLDWIQSHPHTASGILRILHH